MVDHWNENVELAAQGPKQSKTLIGTQLYQTLQQKSQNYNPKDAFLMYTK